MFGPLASEISSTSICRGGLIDETYEALQAWKLDAPKADNLPALREGSSIRARSESWRLDIVSAISRRFDPGGRDLPLTLLAKSGCAYDVWRPILLWHLTRNEFLVRHFLIQWLQPQYASGMLRATADHVIPFLTQKSIRSHLRKSWEPPTLRRVANGLLQTAADFQLLRGGSVKEFTSYHLPEESLLYILHALAESEPNARGIVDAPDWRMYLMDAADVERVVLRLHQFRKVHYEVAGSLAQLRLPCSSSADYAENLKGLGA
jgi:hypothetical protein